jgi:DNA-binding LacI/PurR family transcriptional regulator
VQSFSLFSIHFLAFFVNNSPFFTITKKHAPFLCKISIFCVPLYILGKVCSIIVTLKDVARDCGVSVSTVSRAFDKSSRISQPVRQRILTRATEMGYTPNLIARSLKSNRTNTIALIVPSIENRFYIDVLKHLEITLHGYGYRLLVSFVQPGITTERECLEMVASAKVDAIILIPIDADNISYIESLSSHTKFIQLFTRLFDHIDSVVMDDIGGAELGTNHLLLRGHSRILLVGGEDRSDGFWQAIDAAGICHEQVMTLPWHATEADICNAIRTFSPTAIFSVANTNEVAWRSIQQMELSIPEDISLIVYDNTKWVSLVGLTAVAHDLEQIAATLVSQLLKRLNDEDNTPVVHITLDPFIIERKSVLSR